jgi:hypothetical protein
MNTIYKNISLSVIALFISTMAVFAQAGRDERGEIEDAEIVIEKKRALELPEANRNFEKITAPVRQPDPVLQDYQYIERSVRLPDLNPKFRVLQMPQDPPKKLTGNYIKGGLGNYLTTYLDGYFNSTRNSDYSYGLRVKHLASVFGPVDRENSGNSENMIGVHGRYFTEALTAGAALEYTRERYNYYGYNQNKEVERNDIKQVYNTIAVKTNFVNSNTKSPLDYRLDVNLFNLSDAYNAKEFEVGGQFKGSYKVADNISALLNTDLFFTRRADSATINRNFFRVKPAVQYKSDAITVTAGLNLIYENDTATDLSDVHIYPALHGEYVLFETFTLFAGFEGDMQRTTLRQFVKENPFLGSNIPLFHTNKARDIYAGIKGDLGGGLSFATKVGFTGYKNLYFFVNGNPDTSRFTIQYERDFTNVLNFNGELSYNYAEKFRLALKADYAYYNRQSDQEAWHRPALTTTLLGTYNFNNNCFLTQKSTTLEESQAEIS